MPATDSIHVAKFKAQAKSLHKSVKMGDSDAIRQIEPYFNSRSDFKLTQAQLVVARILHCQSWKELVGKVNWIRCSFCKKWQYEIRKLIAGPNSVYVCDECVELCHGIIRDE